MFDKRAQVDPPLDLMASSVLNPQAITLKDFMELTSHLPKETPLVALVVDEDDVEYARHILSAAVRVDRNNRADPLTRIELRVEGEVQ